MWNCVCYFWQVFSSGRSLHFLLCAFPILLFSIALRTQNTLPSNLGHVKTVQINPTTRWRSMAHQNQQSLTVSDDFKICLFPVNVFLFQLVSPLNSQIFFYEHEMKCKNKNLNKWNKTNTFLIRHPCISKSQTPISIDFLSDVPQIATLPPKNNYFLVTTWSHFLAGR